MMAAGAQGGGVGSGQVHGYVNVCELRRGCQKHPPAGNVDHGLDVDRQASEQHCGCQPDRRGAWEQPAAENVEDGGDRRVQSCVAQQGS